MHSVLSKNLGIEFGTPDKANKFISYLQELKDIRNKCNHYQVLDNEEIDGAYLYIKQAAKLMKMDELVSEIDKIKDQEQTNGTARSSNGSSNANNRRNHARRCSYSCMVH